MIYQQFRSDFIIAALTPLLFPTLPSCLLFSPPHNLQFAQISASPTKFRRPRSKIKGTILAIGHWPKMAKIRDEPLKMTPTSETESFFGVEKFFGVGVLVICLFNEKLQFKIYQYQNLGVKIALFRP